MIGFLLPIFVYAEVHYKWKWFPNRMFMKKPEVIADLPIRLQPNTELPILCIIKDALRFPTILNSINITLKNEEDVIYEELVEFEGMRIEERYWSKLLFIELPRETSGKIDVTLKFDLTDTEGKRYQVINDNLKGLPPLKLTVNICNQNLPELADWHYGDFHTHSEFTDDKVEFGSPIKDSSILSSAIGLEYFVVADHSYNLDNSMEFPFENDENLPRWNALKQLLNDYESNDYSIPVRAEEVSCGNALGENVHLLILNSPKFIPGSGDSEDNYPDRKPTMSINDVLDLMGDEAIAVAAHPLDNPSLGQKIIFNRGYWSKEDLIDERITALQILNGLPDRAFYDGLDLWKELLLEGHKKIILAGNDAHGNFNKFRQIKIPFLSMHQHEKQLFGQVRTAIRYNEKNSDSILEAIRRRRAQICTGPISDISIVSKEGELFRMGDEATLNSGKLQVSAVSSEEFGRLKKVVVIAGDLSTGKESVLYEFTNFESNYSFEKSLSIDFKSRGYIRMETFSDAENKPFSFTNPIWIETSS